MKINVGTLITSLAIAAILGGVGLYAKTTGLEIRVMHNEKGFSRVYKMLDSQALKLDKILRRVK